MVYYFTLLPSKPPTLNSILKRLMYSYQQQHHQTENESTPSVGVPASVIVSSNNITALAPAVHDSQLTDSWVGQSHSPCPGPSHMTAVVKQVEVPLYVKPHLTCCRCCHNTRVFYPFPSLLHPPLHYSLLPLLSLLLCKSKE